VEEAPGAYDDAGVVPSLAPVGGCTGRGLCEISRASDGRESGLREGVVLVLFAVPRSCIRPVIVRSWDVSIMYGQTPYHDFTMPTSAVVDVCEMGQWLPKVLACR